MARRSTQKFENFCAKYSDLVAEYETTEGCGELEFYKQDIQEKIQQFAKINKGCDFNTILSQALIISIRHNQSVLDSINYITSKFTQECKAGVNVTQAYFREIGEIYKKNKNNYNIEYCEENREKLLTMNLKTVVAVAKRYQGLGLSLNELISAGNLGLCIAWEKFDPNRTKLKDNFLEAVADIDDNFTNTELLDRVSQFLTYGDIRKKLDDRFLPGQTYKKEDLIKWIDKNIFNAKFSSIANMWITALILIEIDQNSRVVKKPKSEIYRDKAETGSYQREKLLNLDQPIGNETDTTFADTLGMTDDSKTDMDITESYDIYKNGLNLLLDGIPVRDRAVILKKFGIGLPRPLLPREIANEENLSIARISQIVQITMDRMRKNSIKYNINPSSLFMACQDFR